MWQGHDKMNMESILERTRKTSEYDQKKEERRCDQENVKNTKNMCKRPIYDRGTQKSEYIQDMAKNIDNNWLGPVIRNSK